MSLKLKNQRLLKHKLNSTKEYIKRLNYFLKLNFIMKLYFKIIKIF